jgi:hypothetical protein
LAKTACLLRRDALPHYFVVLEAPIRFVLPPFASAQFKEKPKVPIKEILSDACEVHAGPFARITTRDIYKHRISPGSRLIGILTAPE